MHAVKPKRLYLQVGTKNPSPNIGCVHFLFNLTMPPITFFHTYLEKFSMKELLIADTKSLVENRNKQINSSIRAIIYDITQAFGNLELYLPLVQDSIGIPIRFPRFLAQGNISIRKFPSHSKNLWRRRKRYKIKTSRRSG